MSQDHYSDRMKLFETMRDEAGYNVYYNGLDGLVNDKKRNQFYDKILRQCKGKRCVDVGSGTGILAFLALKHGAKHVTCIEQNKQSYENIKIVSKKMGIPNHKIRVIHDEFRASRFDDYELGPIDIIFHEIAGSHIWNEMIGNTFDVPLPRIKILPSVYTIEFSVLGIKNKLYRKLIDYHTGRSDYENPGFIPIDTGVVISHEYDTSEFINYYQKVMYDYNYEVIYPFRIKNLTHFCEGFVDSIYQKAIPLYTSKININNKNKPSVVKFNLPKTNSPFLLLTHCYMSDGRHVLDWNDAVSFRLGSYTSPIIVPPKFCGEKEVEFTMNIKDDGCMYMNDKLILF